MILLGDSSSIWAEGRSHKDAPVRIEFGGPASKSDGAKKRSIRATRIETHFGITHAGDLVTGSLDDLGVCFDVGPVDCDDLVG